MHTRLQLPQGASCFTFDEARRRRVLETRVVSVFEGWGYDEIVPPLFDAAATFDDSLASQLYTFTGRDGTTLALRPDFTSLVAKIAAGRQGEFHQMGLEFLGGGGPSADIEVIAIAIECLEAVGVSNFVLALGHAGVVTALLDECGLGADDPRRDEALESLNRRDPIALAAALDGASRSEGARKALVGLAEDNGIRQSIDEARKVLGAIPRAAAALDDLESVTKTLDEAGLRGRVAIDLSESRSLDYYTGLVFRVYGGDIGFDVGGGGRYDALLGRLGRPMPAIGFMLGLDRLALLVERQVGWTAETLAPPAPVVAPSLGGSVREARERRARGERIRFGGPA